MGLAANKKKIPDFVLEQLPKLTLGEDKDGQYLNLMFLGERVSWIPVNVDRLFNSAETDYHRECIDRLMEGGERAVDPEVTRQTTAEELGIEPNGSGDQDNSAESQEENSGSLEQTEAAAGEPTLELEEEPTAPPAKKKTRKKAK